MTKHKLKRTTTRVQLELPEPSMKRLNSLMQLTSATSYAEVMRSALKVYKTFVDEQQGGNTIHIVRKDGSTAEVHFLGID